jgi:uncharacterized Fe-S cluster-containing MiaB family protein
MRERERERAPVNIRNACLQRQTNGGCLICSYPIQKQVNNEHKINYGKIRERERERERERFKKKENTSGAADEEDCAAAAASVFVLLYQ